MSGSEEESAGDLHVDREDIAVVVDDGEPALKVGDALIHLETRFEGAPPEHVEKDHYDGPFFLLDFDEEYFDGYLEITPAYEEVSD